MGAIKVIIKKPEDQYGHVYRIKNELSDLQNLVGGYIETLPISDNTVIICNEEGKIMGLPHNMYLGPHDLVGTIIVCGVSGEEFCDVSLWLSEWKELVDANNREEGKA